MAVTVIPSGTVSSGSHTVEYWSASVLTEAKIKSFFMSHGFVGTSPDSIIQEFTDLERQPGDRIHVTLIPDLEGDGVVGDAEVEGTGEPLQFALDDLTIDMLRHEVELPGRMARKRVVYGQNLKVIARDRLATWAGRNAFDQKLFRHMAGVTTELFPATALAPTADRQIFGGTKTTEAGINGTGDFLTIEEIERAKHTAMMADPMVAPIIQDGEEVYVFVMHPRCEWSLRNQGTGTVATQYRTALKDARERAPSNPLFTGALGMWGNVLLYSHRDVPLLNNGTGSRPIARNLLLGRQAAAIAYGSAPFWVEETEDRGNREVVTYGLIYGIKKMVFTLNGKANDFGVVVVSTDAAVPAGTSHT